MHRTASLMQNALNRAKYVFIALLVVDVGAGFTFSLIEGKSVLDGQWWAVVTGFTVGYGDLYPETAAGRLAGIVYIPLMALLWAFLVAHIIAAVIENKHLFSHDEQERFEACLLEMSQRMGVVPAEFRELPSVEWWQTEHAFAGDRAGDGAGDR